MGIYLRRIWICGGSLAALSPLERGIAVGAMPIVDDALKPIGYIYFGYFVGPDEGLGQELWILGSVLMVLCEAASGESLG